MIRKFSILLLFSCIIYSTISAQDISTFDLNGDWKFRRAGTKDWLPAEVPGVVHLDLLRNKIIPDPYDAANESKLQWISEVGWEYKKTFDYDKENFAWRNIDLVCEGIDTYANIYLNDSLIMVPNNMFRKWAVNIKQYLHVGKNTIRIQFPAVDPQVKKEYGKLGRKLPGDEKVVARKAAYHFGWDWGPRFLTCGIWKSIYLRHWTYVNVLDVNFVQNSLTDTLAKLTVQFTLFATIADSATIKVRLGSTEFFSNKVMLTKGINVIKGDFSMTGPVFWWPNGMGAPYLYPFTYEVAFAGNIVGQGSRKVGLRSVELVQEPDPAGRSFYFRINGKPVFIKGANYIPQDNFLPRVTGPQYWSLIDDAKKANLNMLRVWGGGIYEHDYFYDLCDENGIMVWQDFMFACAMYPGNKEFLDNVRDEVNQNIVRLRSHPSVVLWCGNNEIDEGWKNWGWQKQYGYTQSDSVAVYDDYKLIFNGIIPTSLRMLDPTRPYIPTSPLHGWGRLESMSEGDSHYWGVWWGKEPFEVYRQKVGRFMSEYGFQSFPDRATINSFTKPADRTLNSVVMKAHQKHPTGFETIDEYLLRDYKKPKDFDSYAYVSQLLQSDGMKTAIEAHRRSKPWCMGTMFWQFNDCWPVVSWSARDYYGRKKAFGYALTDLYKKITISPVVENNHVKVCIPSDDTTASQAIMTIKVIDFEGNMYSDEGFRVEIPANSSEIYYDTLKPALLDTLNPRKVFMLTTLDGGDKFKEKNILFFVPPKDLLLPVPQIRKIVTTFGNGFKISLISDKFAKNVRLSTSLPGDFTDNYFDMLPGEVKEVYFRTKAKVFLTEDALTVQSLIDTY